MLRKISDGVGRAAALDISARGDQSHINAANLLAYQVGLHRLGQPQRDIRVPSLKVQNGVGRQDVELRTRQLGADLGQYAGQKMLGDQRRSRNAHDTHARAIAKPDKGLIERRNGCFDVFRAGAQRKRGRRRLQRFAPPTKQKLAADLFQLADLPPDRRLRGAQFPGGRAQCALLSDGNEGADKTPIQIIRTLPVSIHA
ncbi:MAG: hypothetical protein QNJ84_18635 [Alphaproteobacteria bacterium]|nr:hypothetical protein [Alphaproteobacteria bacterium]